MLGIIKIDGLTASHIWIPYDQIQALAMFYVLHSMEQSFEEKLIERTTQNLW